MDHALNSLLAASITLIGTHFAMSHPLRARLVSTLGQGGFMGVYSLVSLACILWMYFAFTAVQPGAPPLWTGFDSVSWAVASVLTLLAMVLYAGSMVGNPALPAPGAEQAAQADPKGVFLMTRHPMMWGFALWAIAHIIAAPTARTLIVASTILFLALVGAHMQDRKKRVLMGGAWTGWEAKTSYWPRWSNLTRAGIIPWVIGLILWLALSWAHIPLSGYDAGIWRWL